MNKAVIFDWGGVFMRTEDYTPRHRWDDRLKQPHGTVESVVHGLPEWVALQHGGIDNPTYAAAVAQKLNISLTETTHLLSDFYDGDKLDTSLVDLVRSLRTEGIPVGLLSNNIHELRTELEQLNLIPLFDSIIISAEIGVMKPDPRAYHAALNALNISPSHSIFIDDSPVNIKGAEAVGMAAIHFLPGMDIKKQIREWLNV